MMDQSYIDAILDVILKSDMESCIHSVELRPITCTVEPDGRVIQNVEIWLSEVISGRRAALSKAWVASNLLLFTIFDGYLENRYGLTEGDRFKNHYDNLPSSDDIELIQRDCYRIMRLLRNAMQHNLSGVTYDDGGYIVDYSFRETDRKLKISGDGVACLYTMIINLIRGNIIGLYKDYSTRGHFEGIQRTLYDRMCRGIDHLEDEDGTRTAAPISGQRLEAYVRYPVNNPTRFECSGKLAFRHIYNRAGMDRNGAPLYYSTDYVYGDHILPQEIGSIQSVPGFGCDVIEFDPAVVNDLWKRS